MRSKKQMLDKKEELEKRCMRLARLQKEAESSGDKRESKMCRDLLERLELQKNVFNWIFGEEADISI